MKTRIISGFPGVGKSTLFGQPGNLTVLDSDSSKFSWANEAGRIRHPEWPTNYIDHIRENQGRVDMILVSSHDVVRNALVEAGIEFELVYPGPDMKDEYIKRYVDRGNNPAFVKLLEANYETWIAELARQPGCIQRPLGPGQYLSDVL
jgi:hypothetical protein